MAAKKIELIKLKIDLEGLKEFKALTREIAKLDKSTKKAPGAFKSLAQSIKEVTQFTPKTISQFKQKEKVLKKLREEVRINGIGFKRLGKAIEDNRKKLQAFNAVKPRKGGMFAGIGAGGAAAIGGVGAYIGSSLGLPPAITGLASAGAAASAAKGGSMLAGGLAGAGIGAGITAAAGGVQFAKQAAIQASQVQKLEIALRGAVKTEADFVKGLKIISDTSRKLNVPIAASTKQFTTLSASVVGAGGSIEDAEEVFTGVSNAIKATGGNAEDVQSAIRAMSQIFGKGKVSAEELQGQLGERLAGAVVKFAEANGSSLQKLQKDLRDGTVGLDQVIKFAEKLNRDFSDTAIKISNSSADAGQRLETQINNLSITIGKDLIPIGAALQKQFSEILLGFQSNDGAVLALTESLKAFGGFLVSTIALARTLIRTLVDLSKILFEIIVKGDFAAAGRVINKGFADFAKNFKKDISLLTDISKGVQPPEVGGSGSNTKTKGLATLTGDEANKAQSILDNYVKSVKDVNSQIANSFVNTFKKLEDSLVEFVTTGTFNFRNFAQSIIQEITRIFIRSQIIAPLTGGLGNIFGGGKSKGGGGGGGSTVPALTPEQQVSRFTYMNAKGNVFAGNKIVPYAMGGIVNKPTLFPMANGMGLMGEAGPESVMPLKRGKDGKLGVIAHGGGSTVVNVSVNADGSSVQGQEDESRQLGEVIAAAIQQQIIMEQRPGGLLHG